MAYSSKNFWFSFQTHTQAERKIKEAKREAILREASSNNPVDVSAIKAKLAELDLIKPRPYGTILAVGIPYVSQRPNLLAYA